MPKEQREALEAKMTPHIEELLPVLQEAKFNAKMLEAKLKEIGLSGKGAAVAKELLLASRNRMLNPEQLGKTLERDYQIVYEVGAG